MNDAWLIVAVVALLALIALSVMTFGRLLALARERESGARDVADLRGRLEAIGRAVVDHERDVRQDLAIARNEAAGAGTALRQEIGEVMARYAETNAQLHRAAANSQAGELKAFGERLQQLTQASETRLDAMRRTLEQRLDAMRTENEQKLEQMRATVDEKLQTTLEQRLGASFRHVSERLEQVHRGLGEMQTLATGVGDLKRVLTNVKTRGTWGEVQLGSLLADVLPPAQYAQNVATRPGSKERVEYAVRFPGRGDDGLPCWLPIDAKFPLEDWHRLQDAIERADPDAVEASRRALEQFFKLQARAIRDKYIESPHTTDFAILFVPTEGLFAEAVARPGLSETLQREFRVTIAGPTNLVAMLNSLQLGFRTLAIERRSTEVWRVLGAVKTEFGRFGEILAKTKERLDQVGRTLDEAGRKSTTIARKLRDVEALPDEEADRLLTRDGEGDPQRRLAQASNDEPEALPLPGRASVIDVDDDPDAPALSKPPLQ
jgi:DNA recombination protein RmuC